MRREEEILKRLREEGESLPVPEELNPEVLEDFLVKNTKEHRRGMKIRYMAAALAACFALAASISVYHSGSSFYTPKAAVQEETTDTAKAEKIPQKRTKRQPKKQKRKFWICRL